MSYQKNYKLTQLALRCQKWLLTSFSCLGDNTVVDLFKMFQKKIQEEKHLHNIQVPSQISIHLSL